MTWADYVLIIAVFNIWSLLFVNVILIVAGYVYYIKTEKEKEIFDKQNQESPFISIMVPAHNEQIVIGKTVEALLELEYPNDKYEIIVINDNSSDNSAEVLSTIQKENKDRNIIIINTDNRIGGRGKSNALNIGFKCSKGEYIVIYDADNTPEKLALRYLVSEIENDSSLGAVIGKFRTRNKNFNLLTRFINIETLSFQWMAQAGRWQLFKLCTIPGTNFIIRRSILEEIGGWDIKAIAEDTEISFRIYRMGYKIKFLPYAVTWEQEPQTIRVWFKQRTRWVKGNIYVLVKNFKLIFSKEEKRIKFDLIYFLAIYFLLLISLFASDIILMFNLLGFVHTTLLGFSTLLWVLAFTLFVLGVYVSLTTEKGEVNVLNLIIIGLMYFTYCKMWMIVGIYGLYHYIKDSILKTETKWYKTERF